MFLDISLFYADSTASRGVQNAKVDMWLATLTIWHTPVLCYWADATDHSSVEASVASTDWDTF